jgi:hypothetical protein
LNDVPNRVTLFSNTIVLPVKGINIKEAIMGRILEAIIFYPFYGWILLMIKIDDIKKIIRKEFNKWLQYQALLALVQRP